MWAIERLLKDCVKLKQGKLYIMESLLIEIEKIELEKNKFINGSDDIIKQCTRQFSF